MMEKLSRKEKAKIMNIFLKYLQNSINGRRIYPFNKKSQIYWGEGVPPPFDTLKISTCTYDIKLKLYRYSEISLRRTHHEADTL